VKAEEEEEEEELFFYASSSSFKKKLPGGICAFIHGFIFENKTHSPRLGLGSILAGV
jgi:hypothetical protein